MSAAPPASLSTFDGIAAAFGQVLGAVAPVIAVAIPGVGTAVGVAMKIVQGAIAIEPAAVALYTQITSGTPVTIAQLNQYMSAYETAYQQLDADIKTKLALAAASAVKPPAA